MDEDYWTLDIVDMSPVLRAELKEWCVQNSIAVKMIPRAMNTPITQIDVPEELMTMFKLRFAQAFKWNEAIDITESNNGN